MASRAILPWLLLLGLAFFFGLAFEEFHARAGRKRPGGIRSFPLLALAGGLLDRLDPNPPWLLGIGLAVLGAWLALFYLRHMDEIEADGQPNVGLMVPVCNVLAFLLGPAALTLPPFVVVGTTVAAVLLMTAREELHGFAKRIDFHEIVNAGRFLLIAGLILPLLPDQPVTTLTPITPYQVWLALAAVSTVSYASYLLARYVVPARAGLLTALLGGVYSSTVTTLVLARRARDVPEARAEAQTGIVLANAVMYARLWAIVAVFDWDLARALAVPLAALAGLGAVMAGGWFWWVGRRAPPPAAIPTSINPLGLGSAVGFACLFVIVSVGAAFVVRRFGAGGLLVLAGVIGLTDINPFVLSLAQHGAAATGISVQAGAVVLATASNNLFQAGYAAAVSRMRVGLAPIAGLTVLAGAGIALTIWLV